MKMIPDKTFNELTEEALDKYNYIWKAMSCNNHKRENLCSCGMNWICYECNEGSFSYPHECNMKKGEQDSMNEFEHAYNSILEAMDLLSEIPKPLFPSADKLIDRAWGNLDGALQLFADFLIEGDDVPG